jgi:hypothetical protein
MEEKNKPLFPAKHPYQSCKKRGYYKNYNKIPLDCSCSQHKHARNKKNSLSRIWTYDKTVNSRLL